MADKTEYALHHGLKAIVCIGETLQERESKELWNVLDSQLKVLVQPRCCCRPHTSPTNVLESAIGPS